MSAVAKPGMKPGPPFDCIQQQDVALFRGLLKPAASHIDCVDLAVLRAWVENDIITFHEYADQLAWRGLSC